MATKIIQPDKQSLLDQLSQAQSMLDAKTGKPSDPIAPSPELLDAFKYGATGRSEFVTPEIAKKQVEAINSGVPLGALGDENASGKTNYQNPQGFQRQRLSSSESSDLLKTYRLEGILDKNAFTGLTSDEAMQRASQARKMRTGQISENTSYAFNPETMNKTTRAVDKFGFALDQANNDPFEPRKYKQDNQNNLIDITSKELGQLFSNPADIYSTYQNNPQFKATVDKFIQKGGTLEGIAKNVAAPAAAGPSATTVSDTPNADGTRTVKYADGSTDIVSVTQNADGSQSYNPIKTTQDPASYLAGLRNPQANQQAQDKAISELAPETAVAQDEIARQARIPADMKSLYFGDEKTMGIVQIKRQQAEQESRNLAEKAKDAQRTARDKADLAIEQNNADAKVASAKVEENRLAAKNYMTARLASLGALQTTGAAALALQTLETKYQTEAATLESNLNLNNRSVKIALNDKIDNIENDTNDKVLKIQEDLTKDSETIGKEVLKAQNDSEKEIYRLTEAHAKTLRERTTKYTEDLKAAADKYAKAFAATAGGGLDFTSVGGVKAKSKIVSTIEQRLHASRGSDNYVNSKTYSDAYNEWIQKGGVAKTFLSQFPPEDYVNPNDNSLPPSLRYATPSKTISTKKGSGINFDELN